MLTGLIVVCGVFSSGLSEILNAQNSIARGEYWAVLKNFTKEEKFMFHFLLNAPTVINYPLI